MKICVGSENINLNIEEIKKIFQKVGIKKNFVFSKCYEKCSCSKFPKDSLKIHFFATEPTFFELWYSRINNLFKKGSSFYDVCGTCFKKHKRILVNTLNCIKYNQRYEDVLKHEILHLKRNEHCNNKTCLFYPEGLSKNFCNKCEKDFQKIIMGINS